MDHLTSETLAPRGRAAAWARTLSDALEPLDVVAPDSLAASLDLAPLGPLRLARLRSGDAVLRREIDPARPVRERCATVLFQLAGRSRFKQFGNAVTLGRGDATLCDNAAPYDLELVEPADILLLRAPLRLLREHLPSPDYFCARLVAAGEGLSAPIAAMVLNLVERGDDAPLPEAHQASVARHLLDMVATGYAIAFDNLAASSSVVSGRQASVKLYIEQHLRDPDLTPCTIAARLKLSARYLRMIFATGNETVSAYILRRRLEECARQIADPRWRGHSMTEIAFAWGFNSAPHFTRSFRDRFGMSPRDWRRSRLDESAAIALLAA